MITKMTPKMNAVVYSSLAGFAAAAPSFDALEKLDVLPKQMWPHGQWKGIQNKSAFFEDHLHYVEQPQ